MVRKDKISITLPPTVVGELDDRVGEKYDSRSGAVEDLLMTAFSVGEREREYEERIEELEREVSRLNRERRQLLETREENTELVRYVEDERTWREQGLVTRLKWWVTGKPRGDDALKGEA